MTRAKLWNTKYLIDSSARKESGNKVGWNMEKIEVLCPRCGIQVALTEYGRYLSREFKKFEHSYEGWCPFCCERIVEHVALSGSLEHKVNEKNYRMLIYVD